MKQWVAWILAVCCVALLAPQAMARAPRVPGQRVLLVGIKQPLDEALQAAGYEVEAIDRDALPADAAALASRCTILVIQMDRLPEAKGRAIESFVRGGGGLWIIAGDDWSRHGGSWLDQLSPGIGLDGTRQLVVRARAVQGTPMERVGVETMPTLRAAGDASLPSAGRYGLMNGLSTWYFSKPLWHDEWAEWVVTAPPQEMALLSVARYGAGRTALWTGGRFNEPQFKEWSRMPAFVAAVMQYLGPRQRVQVTPDRLVQVRGYAPPTWWADPLARGLAAMGQKATISDFNRPPEALLEAGFTPTDQPAERVILFGSAANETPGHAQIIVRAPALANKPAASTFDAGKLSVRPVQQVAFGRAPVKLPHRIRIGEERLPALARTPAPRVDLPSSWRMAFTHDPDSDADLQQRWFAPDFDDSAWESGQLGRMETKVFGYAMGYDGAIWYRARVRIPSDAVRPGCVLRIAAEAHQVALWSDGKPIASAPKQLVIPLVELGAGEHLLAIRTYGELRRSYGVTSARVESLPLMWRADPQRRGWAEHWYAAQAREPDWTPVGLNFSNDPVAFGSLEGWVKVPIDVPANARPSIVSIQVALNTETQLFINGRLYDHRSHERTSMYRVPSTELRPGRNDLTLWMRCTDRQVRLVNVTVTPVEPLVYAALVESPVDGASLVATASYKALRQERMPPEAIILVNGQVAGGLASCSEDRVTLVAPGALRRGNNLVEVRLTAMPDEEVGLHSLGVVDAWPAGMPRPIGFWERAPRQGISPQAPPASARWEPVQYVHLRDRERPWVMSPTPDIGDPGYVYRTTLRVQAGELDRPWTLELRGPGIKRIYVNGTPIDPHEEFFYPLNRALKAGDNVITFAVDPSTFRGLNVRLPEGNDRYVYPPIVHHDRAPLEPADPAMGAYALNRLFTVTDLPRSSGRTRVLMRWAHGAPAITLSEANGKLEIQCAPGLFDDVLPAPYMASRFKENGSRFTIEYDYIRRLERDGFLLEKVEQLLPALLNVAEGGAVFTGIEPGTGSVRLDVAPSHLNGTIVAWRLLDWEGLVLASGTTAPQRIGTSGGGVTIELPDLLAADAPAKSSLGAVYRVRAALLSADRRRVLGWIERIVPVQPDVQVAVRLNEKIASLNETTAEVAYQVLHRSIDQLVERNVYLPGEKATATIFLTNRGTQTRELRVRAAARGALDGKEATLDRSIRLLPGEQQRLELSIDVGDCEQPWRVEAEVEGADRPAVDARAFVVAKPRGQITPFVEAHQDLRNTGGYMWQMTQHAFPIEHRLGTDAKPVPDGKEWWTRVRHGGDGNWLVAQGIHRGNGDGDQRGLMWGPFYDQPRGEIMDSYGWFPNGQSIRQWWLPYAVREPLRQYGRQSVVLDLSDWWQNDAGYPYDSFQTFEMFQHWLKAHEGQTIAGTKIESPDLTQARTLRQVQQLVDRRYRRVFNYFHAEGLARTAQYTLEGFREVTGPETIQRGQGAFAHKLPSVVGGSDLAPIWTGAEGLGSLDADNHAFAGDWQYALEAATFRAWGKHVKLITHWEFPQRYHRIHSSAVANIPLGPAAWQRRQLDSRWLVCAFDGQFERVLNLTHNSVHASHAHDLFLSAYLPAHWQINDQLSALAMTVAPDQPLSPLLVVGESDLQWTDYYGGLGKLRDAGLRLGGTIGIRELDAMPAERIPGLVWLPASHVDGKYVAAIVRKLEAGVPVMIVGRLPQTVGDGPDLAQVLKLQRASEGNRVQLEQAAVGEARAWPEADRVTSQQGGPIGVALFEPSVMAPGRGDASPVQPLVVRGDRMASGWGRDPRMKVVIHALPPGLNNPDDAAVRRVSIAAFHRPCDMPVDWDPAASGYAIRGMDGRTYIVVQNMTNRPRTCTVMVRQPVTAAADLLTGRALQLDRSARGGVEIRCPLPAEGATVLVLSGS